MTIKGSFILEHFHVKAVFGRKKTVQSKSVPEMAVFRKFKGPNIKYSYRDPKRHFLTRNDVIWRILRKYPSRGIGCSLIEEPKKTNTLVTPKARQNHVFGEQKPLNRSLQNFACRVPSRTESRLPIFVKIGKGVSEWRWVEFCPFPLTCFVAFKTLSHYRASVWSNLKCHLRSYSTCSRPLFIHFNETGAFCHTRYTQIG